MSQMEVPFIPQSSPQKVDSAKTQAVAARKAYGAGKTGKAESDALQISSKSKLMQKLRASYSELEKADEEKVEVVKMKVDDKTLKMTSEELVHGILKGTLFEIV